MLAAARIIDALRERGTTLWTGVPCSWLGSLIDGVIASPDTRYVGAANEGDAVAIAAGAWLGGRPAAVLMQNSGLGNAVNPLTSLVEPFRVPVFLLVSLRGDPDGPPDEPQHRVMGAITPRLLELMGVPWEPFPAEDALDAALDRAFTHMREASSPYAFVMRPGSLAAGARAVPHPRAPRSPAPVPAVSGARRLTRTEVLAAVSSAATEDDVLIATTGHTGRELYALGDRPNQLYMVGSMGCAAPFGLGLALARPERRIIVLDGDGAVLMRMGALATIGHEHPSNLVHVLLDNGAHESTGGQATVSGSVDLGAVAAACGYARCTRLRTLVGLGDLLRAPGPHFIHVPVAPGTPACLPRPTVTPAQVAARLQAHLRIPV